VRARWFDISCRCGSWSFNLETSTRRPTHVPVGLAGPPGRRVTFSCSCKRKSPKRTRPRCRAGAARRFATVGRGSADGPSWPAAECARSLARTRAMRGPDPSAFRRGTEGFASEKLKQRRWVPACAGTTSGLVALLALVSALLCFRSGFPGPSRPRRGRGGKSPQGHAQDARAFAVRPGMACQRTSAAPSRSRRRSRRPRPRGSPLFGYFLWRDRESNSSAWMADEATHGRESVFVATSQEQNNKQQQTKQERSRAPSPYPLPQAGEGKDDAP
jgi:hypothetical protein